MDIEDLLELPPWEWPPDAGETFLRILHDRQSSASNRLAAAEMAGDPVVVNDALADALLAIIRNAGEPDELRARAAISLGPALELADTDELDDPDGVPVSEAMFYKIQATLQDVYADSGVSKEVRRRVLEASVRAQNAWHAEAVQEAYSSADPDWVLTAVFAMRWVRGFDAQILESLRSADAEVHMEAVLAAGSWQIDAAWPHVVGLVEDAGTPKELLLAAIEAVASIRPQEAGMILVDLADSEDEEIAEAADEAMMMAEDTVDADEDEDEEE